MKKNNMPLNLRERINSRISLLCSVIVLVLLVLVMHQMDYTLIRKPQKEAAEAAALKEQQDKIKAETPVISTASVIAVGDNLYHSKLYESGENDGSIQKKNRTVLTTSTLSLSGKPWRKEGSSTVRWQTRKNWTMTRLSSG